MARSGPTPCTGRAGNPRIQHQNRGAIGLANLLFEQGRPDILGLSQRDRDELCRLLIGARKLGLAAAIAALTAGVQLTAVQQGRQIDAKEPADHDDGDKAKPCTANPAPATTATKAAAALLPAVFDILAFPPAALFHDTSSHPAMKSR